MTEIKDTIIRQMIIAIKHLGAKSDLLGIVCSYGETLSDNDIIELLQEWNSHGPIGAVDKIREIASG